MEAPNFSQFAPVSKAEAERAAQPADAAQAAALPIVSPAPPAPGARFVGGKAREMTLPLDYHVEFEGRTFREITIRRPDSGTVGRYFERLAEIAASPEPDRVLTFPIYFGEDGEPVPEGLMRPGVLDDDDRETLIEASEDFLPGRLRRLRGASQPASR